MISQFYQKKYRSDRPKDGVYKTLHQLGHVAEVYSAENQKSTLWTWLDIFFKSS